jgi:galactokinase
MSAAMREVTDLYRRAFSAEPAVVAAAPGRVEVLGNHTDYNEGFVLSCAIDRRITVAVGPSPDGSTFELVSTHYPKPVRLSELKPGSSPKWVNYPLGVAAVIRQRGLTCPPFRIAVHGDVPLGAGLSSSAALEVSTGIALRELFGLALSDQDVARIGQKAENTFAGAQCGLLDQFSSLFGKENHLLFTDFRTLEHKAIAVGNPDLLLVLTISGVTHSLAECPYNERRQECKAAADYFSAQRPEARTLRDVSMSELLAAEGKFDRTAFRRARHVVGEDERVLAGIELLGRGDLAGFGALLFKSHESSRDHFQNSCPELDKLVAIASSVRGVYGSRLTGGGFGGATLTLLPASAHKAFQEAVGQGYHTPRGALPDMYVAKVADGARVLKGL